MIPVGKLGHCSNNKIRYTIQPMRELEIQHTVFTVQERVEIKLAGKVLSLENMTDSATALCFFLV